MFVFNFVLTPLIAPTTEVAATQTKPAYPGSRVRVGGLCLYSPSLQAAGAAGAAGAVNPTAALSPQIEALTSKKL